MPPKVDIKILSGKRDNAKHALYELFDEFEALYSVKPELNLLSTVFKEIESKYRGIKKQIEGIADRFVEEDVTSEDERVTNNLKSGDEIKQRYLETLQKYASYEKELSSPQLQDITESTVVLGEVATAVKQMAQNMAAKPKIPASGLERLSVPSWDGSRKTYITWKKEFNHWMSKYEQDKDEQLQRFRRALPKGSWWAEQVKTCKVIDRAWEILDIEFADRRKLMDALLAEVNSYGVVRSDPKSLARYATSISVYVSDMEDNGCPVQEASEAPFFMSRLLSNLDPKDNAEFGREMKRQKKDENVTNLVTWLHQEASLRSRGKTETEGYRSRDPPFHRKSDQHSSDISLTDDETCPLGCNSKHLLASCPVYHKSSLRQRWDIVRQNRRCRKCLRGSHHTNDCKKADGTSCDKCKKNHHRSLHNEKKSEPLESNLRPAAPVFTSQFTPPVVENRSIRGSDNEKTSGVRNVLGICPVQKIKIRDCDGNLNELLALLDTGSNTSLLSKKAAKQLGLSGPQTHLTMNLAGGQKKAEVSEMMQIDIVSPTDEDIVKSLQVHTVRKPCSNAKSVPRKAIDGYAHLKSIADKLHLSGGAVDLLVGTDFVDAFIDIHTLSGDAGEPVAKRNCFGWYILGQVDSGSNSMSEIRSVDVATLSAVEDIKKLVHQDFLGVRPTELCTCSENALRENKFVKALSTSTTLVDGRVQVKMPWKEAGPPKRSNYDLALKRMYSAEKSFKKRDCFEIVDEEVQKLVEQGFIIKVPHENVNHGQPEWYMPLQAVFTPEKSTKVRLVFDSSSKGHDGLSLNDHLEKGPNYINSLPNVLTAWRWDEYAYSGDIRKMFNQVLVHPDDQVFHRFLWRKNQHEPPTVYQWLRLNFGDKPAPDIASNAIKILAKASQVEFPEAAKELEERTYVDDIGGSRPSTEEAKHVTNTIDKVLAKGQFQIKAWHSNSPKVDQSSGDERFTDLLGHRWDKHEDTFCLKKDSVVRANKDFTKRSCLALLAQVWDPIGLVAPVTLKFRIDLQELWSAGHGWDDVLPGETQQKWKGNEEAINQILTFKFDRKLKPSRAIGSPQVHGFADGGELGYGAGIFLRWKLHDESYQCIPVIVKPFVAPLKQKTIPRLELLGCLALTRIYNTCQEALSFVNFKDFDKTFWTDSRTVLSWIKTPPREFRPFVSVRVAEIQETVGSEQFRYIRSKYNPADALTRGIAPADLQSWMSGPPFLNLPETEWPQFQDDDQSPYKEREDALKEMKTTPKQVDKGKENTRDVHATSVSEGKEGNSVFSHLLEKCSTFTKIRRVLAYVHRFAERTRRRDVANGSLTVQELMQAELQLLKWSQKHINVQSLDKKLIASMDEEGLIRAHGRLENARILPKDMRNPVVLPRDHQLTILLLRHLHRKRGHCGYKSLMHEARRKYWIIGLRKMAKAVVSNCVLCRKLRRKPLDQLMGQVPSLRVAAGFPPFSNTAMDMFGPLQIRLNRRTLQEAQVVIFTCTTTRAIHLELVTDKSSEAFLMAFRRFACLHGHPNVCWSDCGSNFVGAQEYLREVMQDWDIPKIQSAISEEFACDFEWQWNTPHASHQNGVVESLIKSVRQALNSVCKNQAFTEEQWRTFLTEITYMVNSRPLYPSSEDIWDEPPITPNDLLIGQHNPPPQPELEARVNPRHLLRSVQNRVGEFWICWMKYFAPTLLPRNKWFQTRENVKIGDLVLELNPNRKRTQWEMALITNVFPGKDGLVRKVRIKTQNGEYDRPIHKLCVIATREELSGKEQ